MSEHKDPADRKHFWEHPASEHNPYAPDAAEQSKKRYEGVAPVAEPNAPTAEVGD
jgi:hypothetical protein